MFSKAKRFEPVVGIQSKDPKKQEITNDKPKIKLPSATKSVPSNGKVNHGAQFQTSLVKHVKSFVTPKPVKSCVITKQSSLKKPLLSSKNVKGAKNDTKINEDIIKSQETAIRNNDSTIVGYNKQIRGMENEIICVQKQIKNMKCKNEILNNLDKQIAQISLQDGVIKEKQIDANTIDYPSLIKNLNLKIFNLEQQCEKLEQEISEKQVDLSSLEDIITIRDSLCKDLQDKLTNTETRLEETSQRLEMVKGHHSLALEANESIRREYKVEIETLKAKLDEEKQAIIAKCKIDQEIVKTKYNTSMETLKDQITKEKDKVIHQLQNQLSAKDHEMKAKLEQIEEATREKLKLCEIQFEEQSRSLQEHWSQQQLRVQYLEKEAKELKSSLNLVEEKSIALRKEINDLKNENNSLKIEKSNYSKQLDNLKEQSKKKIVDFENQMNKLTVEVDKATKEKNMFEMSLSVTRDIVQVLTMRLRESDNELEHLENKVKTLTESKEVLENELATYKMTLNNTLMECNEYKEALVNILKSKAALAKEHTRLMEHNVSLIESLQNVEKEAYREFGSIKRDLIEDVELLKIESKSQIQILREEVEKKRMLCDLAREHAGQATAAAEQSRSLLAQAAAEISRLEEQNECLHKQIQDQQSLVVELSLLRQENEELIMTAAKQTSLIDKMKKEMEQTATLQSTPKSPSVVRKVHKMGKENIQTVISPLRERNH